MIDNKNNKYSIIIRIAIITLLAVGATFAAYIWYGSDEDETKIVTSVGRATVYFNGGDDITGADLKPTLTKEEGIIKEVTVKAKKDVAYKLSFNLYLDIVSLPEELKEASFKYEIYKDGVLAKEGNFSTDYLTNNLVGCTTNNTSHIVLINDESITSTKSVYTLYLWIDFNMDNPSDMQKQNFEFHLHADGQNANVSDGENMIEFISNLYNNSEKTQVVSDITYNYVVDEKLMNDRLGLEAYFKAYFDSAGITEANRPFTTSEGCYKFFDCEAKVEAGDYDDLDTCESEISTLLTNLGVSSVDEFCGITDIDAGNIRYYGATPNNYIDIGDATQKDITVGNWVAIYKSLGASEEEINEMIPNQDACYKFLDCEAKVEAGDYDDLDTCETERDSELASLGVSSVDEMCGVEITPAGTPILYRIVGLFKDIELEDGTKKDLIKVVRNEPIGAYSWDTSASDDNTGYGYSDWTQADLMKLLNTKYENNTDFDNTSASILVNNSLYWNSGAGTCYAGQNNTTTTCDFTSVGLSDNVKNNIQPVNWKLTAGQADIYPSTLYYFGNNRDISTLGDDYADRSNYWEGNVALIELSDFAYASDLNVCNQTLSAYTDTNCLSTNWVVSNVQYQWTLTLGSLDDVFVIANDTAENLFVIDVASTYYDIFYVRPSFFLNPELLVVGGKGTEKDPYVVG